MQRNTAVGVRGVTVTASDSPRTVVRNTLEANGFGWKPNELLDPVERWEDRRVLHSRTAIGFETDLFVPTLASYEFRKLLRHLIGLRGEPILEVAAISARLGQSTEATAEFLEVLDKAGLLSEEETARTFIPNVDSLGPTVEWYVAYLFNRDLHWAATTNVLLEDTEYNDFDVVGVHGNEIAHVECKTSAPDQVSDDELVALAERHYFLKPAFTLLLVDTSSSVQSLATRVGNIVLKHQAATAPFTPIAPNASVLNGARNVYVGNANAGASNGLRKTLRLTVRHHSTEVRGMGAYG